MLTDKQIDRYTDILLWGLQKARTSKFKKNDIITLSYNLPAIRLAEAVFERLMSMGMNPVQRMILTDKMELSFFKQANEKQLVFIPPGEEELVKNINGSISLYAPQSLTHLSDIDPKKIGKVAVAKKFLRDIIVKREEEGSFGWTLCMCPTEELAKHAGLTLEDYTKQIIKACFLDKRSPIDEWESIYKNAMSIKAWLNSIKVKHYHIESQNVDLKITPGENRKWIGISGHNIPSFEIFTSPDWRGTEGKYYADQPSYRSGNYVENVRLVFKKGIVVEAEAEKGEDFLKKALTIDKGANKIGEFSLTDKRFSKINRFMANTLFDENFGGKYGNCHIAAGASYSNVYDGNANDLTKEMKDSLGFNDSALHWDLVNTEKKIVTAHLVTGEEKIIYENGMFTY